MATQVSTGADRMRAIINSLKKKKGVIATQSYLRLEQPLGTTGSIAFQVLQSQQNTTVNEKRLALPDSFLITSLAIMTYKISAGSNVSTGVLNTFPNPFVYTTAGEAAALQALYNGYLSVRVNSVVYIDSLDTYRFYRAGVAQKGLDVSTGTNPEYQASEWNKGDYPFYGLTPGVMLSGATKNELNLVLPESSAMGAKAGDVNYVVLYLRGVLLQNAATFNPRG